MIVNASKHDWSKIQHIDDFYVDFKTGFQNQDWFDMHKKKERHHLEYPEGVRDDVNLMDLFECICDRACAGMARGSSVEPPEIPSEVLQKAYKNTFKMLVDSIEVEKPEEQA